MIATSTFAQRFEFARARQHLLGTWQEDSDLASALRVAPSRISEYKTRDDAPAAARTLTLAAALGVDPGWLAFGGATLAPAPDGFSEWLATRYPARVIQNAEPHVKPVPDRRARKKKTPKRASG